MHRPRARRGIVRRGFARIGLGPRPGQTLLLFIPRAAQLVLIAAGRECPHAVAALKRIVGHERIVGFLRKRGQGFMDFNESASHDGGGRVLGERRRVHRQLEKGDRLGLKLALTCQLPANRCSGAISLGTGTGASLSSIFTGSAVRVILAYVSKIVFPVLSRTINSHSMVSASTKRVFLTDSPSAAGALVPVSVCVRWSQRDVVPGPRIMPRASKCRLRKSLDCASKEKTCTWLLPPTPVFSRTRRNLPATQSITVPPLPPRLSGLPLTILCVTSVCQLPTMAGRSSSAFSGILVCAIGPAVCRVVIACHSAACKPAALRTSIRWRN